MKLNLQDVSKGTWTRTIVLVVTIINQGLVLFNKNILPYDANQIAQVVSFSAVVIMAIISWWKNNSFTKIAQDADKQKKIFI